MSHTASTDSPLVLINTFVVAPERAEELLELLDRATAETMQHQPGFISARLHVNADATRVVNYAEWGSRADFDAMLANPEAQVHMREAASIAESYEPVFYERRHSYRADRVG